MRLLFTLMTMALFLWVPAFGQQPAQTAPVNIRWQRRLESPPAAPPCLSGDSLLVATRTHMRAFAPSTGQPRWSRELSPVITMACDASVLWVATEEGFLYALDSEGEPRWKIKLPGQPAAPPAVNDHLLVVTTPGGHILALERENGQVRWQRRVDAPVEMTPLLTDNTLYAGDYDGNVLAMSLEQGEPLWRESIEGPLLSTPVLKDGELFVTSAVGALFTLDAQSGKRHWSMTTGTAMISPPVPVKHPEEGVCAADIAGQLNCAKSPYGLRTRTMALNEGIFAGLYALDQQNLLALSGSGSLIAVSPGQGQVLWRHPLKRVLRQRAAMDENRLFLVTEDGQLYALEVSRP